MVKQIQTNDVLNIDKKEFAKIDVVGWGNVRK
jgi:hypothetical protein